MKKSPVLFLIFCFIITSCTTDNDPITDPVENVELSTAVTTYEAAKFEEDYLLVTPIFTKDTYLINRQGFPVRKWASDRKALVAYMDLQGNIYRQAVADQVPVTFGGQTGIIEKYNPSGEKIWEYTLNDENNVLHHDLAILPNGNLLATVWERKSQEESLSMGRREDLIPDGSIWPDKIIEIQPRGTNQGDIVWEWNLWDHLVQDHDETKPNYGIINEHPEKININYSDGSSNFTHFNSIFYIEDLDQIVVSSRVFNEMWVIDHSTTTLEAATNSGGRSGKGGDLLYRWGNPQAYNVATASDQKLFGQHDVSYIGNLPNNGGNFLIFNNEISTSTSAVVEVSIPTNSMGSYDLKPNVNNDPADYSFIYESVEIYSPRTSGARRLKNGNTLITSNSAKIIREINSQNDVVWEYTIDNESTFKFENSSFKVNPYPKDHPAFDGVVLTPLDPSLY